MTVAVIITKPKQFQVFNRKNNDMAGLLKTMENEEGSSRETDSLEGIPSELLDGIDVYKSPNPTQLGGELGGIVNLKTRYSCRMFRYASRS
jgi:hypothetical protein